MSYPSLKKRRNDATTPPSVSFSSPQKVQRDYVISAKSVTPGKKQQSEQFLKNQESLYQQEMEALNEHTIMLMQKPSSSRAKMFLAADYLRCQRDIEALYKPAPGIVLSMGQDDCSQLGISTDNDEEEKLTIYPPTLVRNVTTRMVQVAAGGLHSLALEQGGHVYTWGCNDDGALGRVTDDDNELAQSTATLIDSKSMDAEDQGQVVQIGAGDSHSIYKTHNGNVYMSGMYKDVDSGKFRDAPPGKSCKGSNAIPTKVHKLNQPVKTVSCGASFNAAILADDSMVTWGMGHVGELARSADMTTPTMVNGKRTFDLGKEWITHVYQDEQGEDQMRYLVDKIDEKFLTPLPPRWSVPGQKKVLNVTCGGYHLLVCARDVGSFQTILYTSGLNQYGQLGMGDTEDRHELTPVETLRDEHIVKCAAGEHFSLGLNLTGNKIFSWGRSDYGQLGLFGEQQKSGEFESTPQRVPFPDMDCPKSTTLFETISAGDRHGIAITTVGQVYTWGFGETGTTGHEFPENWDGCRPRKLDVLRDYRDKNVAANSLVLSADGGGQHTLMTIERYS